MATGMDEVTPHPPFPDTGRIATAVVTGAHPYHVPGFHALFRSLPDIDHYPQTLEDFVFDWGKVRTRYDVTLFFNFHQETPNPEARTLPRGTQEALEQLGETAQGIVFLHHALGAFPQWPFWSALTGIPHEVRTYEMPSGGLVRAGLLSFCEPLRFEVVDPAHPITAGVASWDMPGETWKLSGDPSAESHWLLRTAHPKMHMTCMAWTHQFRSARVFCLQPGHNNDNWTDPRFRTILGRGIQWAAGRL